MGFITQLAQDNQVSGSLVYDDTINITQGVEVSGLDMEYDLNALRSNDNRIIGNVNWWDAIPISLSGARVLFDTVISFTGMTGDSDGTPTWVTQCATSPGDSLEAAIEAVDTALCVISGIATSGVCPDVYPTQIVGTKTAGTYIAAPALFEPRVGDSTCLVLYYNGNLMSGQDNDYVEVGNSGITTNRTFANNKALTWMIYKHP